MNPLEFNYSRWSWLFFPLTFFTRVKIYPESLIRENFKKNTAGKSIIYVMPHMSIMDAFILNRALKKLGEEKVTLPAKPRKFGRVAMLALKSRRFFFSRYRKDLFIHEFMKLAKHDNRTRNSKLILIPVVVFWSRAPERNEKGFLLRLLFPEDGTGNSLQKLFTLILHRGEVNVSFGKIIEVGSPSESPTPLPVPAEFSPYDPETHAREYDRARRLRRLVNIEFARERAAIFGPTLYDNEKIALWVLSSPSTRKLLQHSESPVRTEEQIIRCIEEIAASYNYATIRALEGMFDFIWNRIFEGVRLRNFEQVESVMKEGQIIWMPSHRSHFDYLLLSSVLFKKGFVIPHIAAGLNLNFWPVGAILRKGGAFFIRRSFAGNRVYAHTFSEYVNFLMQHGFPIEFFHEGGRSRIGKLLPPKIGMLGICLQSILSRRAVNTNILPVYFCYDKVMEDDSYAKELGGAKKKKENAFHFLNGVRKLFSNYGSVDVSFGDPLRIGDVWQEFARRMKLEDTKFPEAGTDPRNPMMIDFTKYLASRVNQKINCAAVASHTSLLATALLSRPSAKPLTHATLKYRVLLLHYCMEFLGQNIGWKLSNSTGLVSGVYESLMTHLHEPTLPIKATPDAFTNRGNSLTSAADALAEQIFAGGERWNFLQKIIPRGEKNQHILFAANPEKELNLWWYRGTIFHAIAVPGIVAKLILKTLSSQNATPDHHFQATSLLKSLQSIRNIWEEELYWDEETSSKRLLEVCLTLFCRLELITATSEEDNFSLKKDHEEGIKTLQFLAGIVEPEAWIYGFQLEAATRLAEEKNHFSKEELMQRALTLHTREESGRLKSSLPASVFSRIFAQRTFDAFVKADLLSPTGQQKFCIHSEKWEEFEKNGGQIFLSSRSE